MIASAAASRFAKSRHRHRLNPAPGRYGSCASGSPQLHHRSTVTVRGSTRLKQGVDCGPRLGHLVGRRAVLGLQAVLAVVVSLPVQAVLGDPDPSPLQWLDWIGAAIWTVGLAFESVGD